MCDHKLGSLSCINPEPHIGDGRGCVHDTGTYIPHQDDHKEGDAA
jgi:hypothetical protein